jgi:hypothetical protein
MNPPHGYLLDNCRIGGEINVQLAQNKRERRYRPSVRKCHNDPLFTNSDPNWNCMPARAHSASTSVSSENFSRTGKSLPGSGEYSISTRLNSLRFYARSFVWDGRPLALIWCSSEPCVSSLSFLEAWIGYFQRNAEGRKVFLGTHPILFGW